jgi:hypothetical protein
MLESNSPAPSDLRHKVGLVGLMILAWRELMQGMVFGCCMGYLVFLGAQEQGLDYVYECKKSYSLRYPL